MVKYPKEQYILEKLITRAGLREIIKTSWYIAGGACTSVFSGTSVNDLDIYFESIEDLQSAIQYIRTNVKTDEESFVTECAFSFKRNGLRIQYIKKIVGKPIELIKQFDFSICECAYLPETKEFVMGEDFLADLCARRLRYNIDGKYPIASLWRLKKYIERGFKLPAIESIKLSLCINNLNIKTFRDLKEQLEGIDTLFLKELTDVLIDNGEKRFNFNEALEFMNEMLEGKLNTFEEESI